MSNPTDPLAWVERAEEDYALARSSLRRKVPSAYGATFHAQQCAEKYLKAILIDVGQPFPKTHDLVAVYDLCLSRGITLSFNLPDLQRLSAYAVQVRYPGMDPTIVEAKEALKIAQSVRRAARNWFSLP